MGSTPRSSVTNEDIVRAYDRGATLYDWLVRALPSKTRRRALDLLSLEGDETVLEIGSGPGWALRDIHSRLDSSGQIVGLDAAEGMIARADRRIGNRSGGERIHLLLGDARELPFPDNGIDAVFIEDTLELFSRSTIQTVLSECDRVLVPDGRIGVVTMEREGAETDLFVRGYDWIFEHVPGYDRVGCRPIYARRALETEGFAIEQMDRYRRGYVWPVEILIARPSQA